MKQTKESSEENKLLKEYQIDSINVLIALFNERNIDKISTKINFPLHRQYPIPPITNKEEFKSRFNEVFDDVLISRIIKSRIEQWSEMGWRGIMLDDGVLWMANSDGVITSVNYQSEYETELIERLIAKDRENLHASLQTFESPVYKITTKSKLIRIDELTNYKYRYSSWKIGEKESSAPETILNNGEWEFLGSGGNHVITFVQGNLTYSVYRNILGREDTPDFTIEVVEDEKVISTEDGTQLTE
ncbi:MAG: hypothetical protein EAZ58_12405 [Flavobacterium sp.]|nr:MAG: hypothetical protein EAZ58_12405 [Flavobacterium sp.]